MKLLIIGNRQHGKSDVGNMLSKALSVVAHDSSWYACENVVFPQLKEKYGYATAKDAHDDRMNHRQEWFEIIEAYNDEPDRLTRAILSEGSIYVGMRSRIEFEGSKHHFDHVIWVDASERVSAEGGESMKLTKDDADYVLNNNGPLVNLPHELGNLLTWLAYRLPPAEDHLLVYGIDPVHHLARGTLGAYIAEQLIHGSEEDVAMQLGSLYGPGTDELMTPMRMVGQYYKREGSEEVEKNHFEGSLSMGEHDVIINKDAGDLMIARAKESDEAMHNLYGHELSVGDLGNVTITSVDPSMFERSFNNLQRRITEWAKEHTPPATRIDRFSQLKYILDEIVYTPEDPTAWADALLVLMHAIHEAGFTMHEDMLKACYDNLSKMSSDNP